MERTSESSREGKRKMMFRTKTEKRRVAKKVEIAIDKMIDLQDDGHGCDAISRILEQLNSLSTDIEVAPVGSAKR